MTTTTKPTAAQRLASLPEIKPMKPLAIHFERLTTSVPETAAHNINKLFRRGTDEDRIAFARELMDLFGNANDAKYTHSATELFEIITPEMGRGSVRYMITISNSDQFRVWYGIPCDFGTYHVESNGHHYLLEASRERDQLIELAKKLMPDSTKVTLPNGVLLFLRLGDRHY